MQQIEYVCDECGAKINDINLASIWQGVVLADNIEGTLECMVNATGKQDGKEAHLCPHCTFRILDTAIRKYEADNYGEGEDSLIQS